MTTININTVEPAGATLTIGASGDTVKVNDSVKVNTVKDAGGNTLWVSNGSGVLSSVSGFGDALVLLSTQNETDVTSIDFTSGIDSTYKEYVFKFIDIDVSATSAYWTFQVNAVGASGFDETITSTWFYAALDEIADGQFFSYGTSYDQANGTGYQTLAKGNQNDSDSSVAGELHLFNPSSTTYVKNFYARVHYMGASSHPYAEDAHIAGYINTTSAIDEVSFKTSSGNFGGTVKMYGVK